jgi:pantoate--beta-alanine ligase
MKKFIHIKDIQSALHKEHSRKRSIGFVATMGALHEGHLSLVRQSKEENDITVASIFVNPIQFNRKEDLLRYPRMLKEDFSMLESVGCDYVFYPEVEEMYPEGENDLSPVRDFGMLDKVMEGKFRPGHFKGVAIVVKKLFDIIAPDSAYFGKKDYQQLMVIRKLVEETKLPVRVVGCPIIREKDGLAMSSRNMHLTIGERSIAPLIFQVLSQAKEKAGSVSVKELKTWATKKIEANPAFKVEYFEIADNRSLLPLESWKYLEYAIACAAVFLGGVRLIDNLELF